MPNVITINTLGGYFFRHIERLKNLTYYPGADQSVLKASFWTIPAFAYLCLLKFSPVIQLVLAMLFTVIHRLISMIDQGIDRHHFVCCCCTDGHG